MEVRATPGQIARVRRAIERSDAAERFAFLDKHDAYRVFSQIFHDDPNLVKNTDSAVLPTSFRVDLASSDDRFPFRQQFEALPGVDTVEIALTDEEEQVQRDAGARRKLCDAEADAEVFMVVRSSPAQEQTVADALASTKGVLSARRISHDEALTTFNCIFADHPELLAGVTAESLPVSFRVELANAAALGRVAPEHRRPARGRRDQGLIRAARDPARPKSSRPTAGRLDRREQPGSDHRRRRGCARLAPARIGRHGGLGPQGGPRSGRGVPARRRRPHPRRRRRAPRAGRVRASRPTSSTACGGAPPAHRSPRARATRSSPPPSACRPSRAARSAPVPRTPASRRSSARPTPSPPAAPGSRSSSHPKHSSPAPAPASRSGRARRRPHTSSPTKTVRRPSVRASRGRTRSSTATAATAKRRRAISTTAASSAKRCSCR